MNCDEPETTTMQTTVRDNEMVSCDAATSVWDALLSQMYFESLLELAHTRLN